MLPDRLVQGIGEVEWLRSFGLSAARSIHDAILDGGAPVRHAVDVLHGKWLGHPLHPVLTDIVVGAWTIGAVLDVLSLRNRSKALRWSADRLDEIGTVVAVPTAVSGLADYSGIKRDAVAHGTLHGLTNAAAQTLHVLSLWARRRDDRTTGVVLAAMGTGLVLIGGWLGGELVFRLRVGVNHNPPIKEPKEWTAVYADAELPEQEPRRVDAADHPVLLYRLDSQVYALSAVCAHAGGPLDEGEFDGACVTCPWHQSVYDLRDGYVVHGPSAFSQPTYQVRIREGQIELRASTGVSKGSD